MDNKISSENASPKTTLATPNLILEKCQKQTKFNLKQQKNVKKCQMENVLTS